MPLISDVRSQKIKAIYDGENYGVKEILWNDPQNNDASLQPMPYFKIPLEYLIYNVDNGRILSRTLAAKAQEEIIDPESDEGNELIEAFLEASDKPKNIKTEADIRKWGQKEVGIVTLDGIVIDGNRRLMTLNKLFKNPGKDKSSSDFKHFKAVILPVKLKDNFKEIKRLETIVQMGEDKKADYGAIEKYLQVKTSLANGISEDEIAEYMTESVSKIKDYRKTLVEMEKYLDYLGYENQYPQLFDREDYLIYLGRWMDTFKGPPSKKGYEGYDEMNVGFLEMYCFDLIRCYKEVDKDKFKKIAGGVQDTHIFGNKEIWQRLFASHQENVIPLKEIETDIDWDSRDVTNFLQDRDKQFTKKAKEYIVDNLDDRITELNYHQSNGKPGKQVDKVNIMLDSINTKAQSFTDSSTLQGISAAGEKAFNLLKKAGSFGKLKILQQVTKMLSEMDDFSSSELEDGKILKELQTISSKAHNVKKEAGG
jgi:hypothetical protein